MSPTLEQALRHATDTKALNFGAGVLSTTPDLFTATFPAKPPVIIADPNTFAAAGQRLLESLAAAGHACLNPFIFTDEKLSAEHAYVEQLQSILADHDSIPIAVGSGTINDLTKLAAHRLGRPCLCVATAASMDGYTAFGASITQSGSKQTFACPAPRAVVADLDVIRAAPPHLNAAGFADLLAKITAGADWILADALGVEPIDEIAWGLVQKPLRESLLDPSGVRGGDEKAVTRLTESLLLSGFAMQHHQSSRPASGAEHQFSHLWDMQHATTASHGFKVGVATVAVSRLYEALLSAPPELFESEELPPSPESIADLFDQPEIAAKALEETRAKQTVPRSRIRESWPTLRPKLRAQLLASEDLARMLHDVGAPSTPEEIGIAPQQMRRSFRQAYHIRRRYTVLDLLVGAGLLDRLVDQIVELR